MLLASCGAAHPYPLFSRIQNGFLLITIIPKVLKHINRWEALPTKGQPAGFYGLVQQQLILHSVTNPIEQLQEV